MKKAFIIVSLLLLLSMLLAGCGKAAKQAGADNPGTSDLSAEQDTGEDAAAQNDSAKEESSSTDGSSEKKSGKFECIADISDYWNNLYNSNEEVLNAYEGMPIMELVTPGLCFVTGVQYDILNIYNEDGRFEGNLMLAGFPGFEEKKGSSITFGYENAIKEDSQFSNTKAGDKEVESGNCDLSKGYYFAESYTDRSGSKISRSTNEFQLQADKSMCALVIDGSTLGYNNEENLTTSYIFIRAGEGQYDFAVGKSTTGTAFETIKLEDNMTKDMAIAMFESAGASIEYSGGIKDGVFYVD